MSRASTKSVFVKERLIEARDARAITQAELARVLNKAGPTISNWERGEQAPEPGTLEQLAQALDVTASYLTRPMPQYGSGAIFFRSLSSATVKARTREKARLRWLQHISLTLQNVLDFPEVDLPDFLGGVPFHKLSDADLEGVAESMRRHWNLGEGPIRNALLVAENAGVVVGVDEAGSTKIDGQGNWLSEDGRPYILLARNKYTAFRRQMDVAHELAHLVLHRHVDDAALEQHFDLIEDQAKYLACAFLLPHRSFASEVHSLSLDGFLALKPRWMVSVGAMIMRAHQLEMMSDEAARRLWKYRATRGWHRCEPLDSPADYPVEEPRLLRRSIEMIVDAKVRAKQDFLRIDLGFSGPDVELLASLPSGYFREPSNVVAFEPRLREPAMASSAAVVPFRRPV